MEHPPPPPPAPTPPPSTPPTLWHHLGNPGHVPEGFPPPLLHPPLSGGAVWGEEVQEQVRCLEGGADHKMLLPTLSALLWCVSAVGAKINGSMVNFLGCEVGGCEEVRCRDGTLAPSLPGRCCGDIR